MSPISQNLYFNLGVLCIIVFAVGVLYYVVHQRGKILEGLVDTAPVPAPTPTSTTVTGGTAALVTGGTTATVTGGTDVPASTTPAATAGGVAVSAPTPTPEPPQNITFLSDPATPGYGGLTIKNIRFINLASETAIYIHIPSEIEIKDYKRLKIEGDANSVTRGVKYAIDDFINICDSTVAYDLFFSNIKDALVTGSSKRVNVTTVKNCADENKLKIIISDPTVNSDPSNQYKVYTFKIIGLPIPTVSPVLVTITNAANNNNNNPIFMRSVDISGGAPNTNLDGADRFSDASFKIALSDETPGAKNVTAKYTFKFKPANEFTLNKPDGGVIHFIFSNDFVLPPVENMKVAINDTLLDAGKNEYVLQYKTTCITPEKGSALSVSDNYKFKSENKICMNIYTLFIKNAIKVSSDGFTVALKGLTNPPYSPPTVAYDKQDYLFRAFSTSYCILNLNVAGAGRFLFNPMTEDYMNASMYMRGNYPIKNKKPADDDGGDNAGDSKMKSSANQSVESRAGSSRAANVYTVNYFYDGQGQGEYGYIARPDIFGTTPYSYGTSRSGLGTSDKYLAKQSRDLDEQRRVNEEKQQQWQASQVRPPMGVAPALLNAGVQPYDSSINF